MKKLIVGIVLTLALLGGTGAYFLTRTSPIEAVESTQQPITVIDLFNEVNTQRRLTNLPELMLDPKLNQSACDKLADMELKSYYSHDTPDGGKFSMFVEAHKPEYVHTAENLAITNEGGDIVANWMNSDGHRKSILDRKYSAVGYCVKTVRQMRLEGTLYNDSTLVVQHFTN